MSFSDENPWRRAQASASRQAAGGSFQCPETQIRLKPINEATEIVGSRCWITRGHGKWLKIAVIRNVEYSHTSNPLNMIPKNTRQVKEGVWAPNWSGDILAFSCATWSNFPGGTMASLIELQARFVRDKQSDMLCIDPSDSQRSEDPSWNLCDVKKAWWMIFYSRQASCWEDIRG